MHFKKNASVPYVAYCCHLFIHLSHIFCMVLIFYFPFRHCGPLLMRGDFPFVFELLIFVHGDVILHSELTFLKQLKLSLHSCKAE